jgi:hypothetical protein
MLIAVVEIVFSGNMCDSEVIDNAPLDRDTLPCVRCQNRYELILTIILSQEIHTLLIFVGYTTPLVCLPY